MIWYVLIATFLFIGFYSKYPKTHYWLSLIILFVFTAFRDTTLGDYYNTTYISIFENASVLSEFNVYAEDYELGYMLLNSLSKFFSDDFRVFQVIYTLLAIILLHLVVNKLRFTDTEKNLFLFVYFAMRFVINNFIILRQNIANLIVWYAVLSGAFILMSLVLIVISAQFHITSYANVVTASLMKALEKLDRKATFLITCLSSLFLVTASSGMINTLVNNFITFAGEKYAKYLVVEGATVGFNWIYYFLRVGFFVLFYIFYDDIESENKSILFYVSAIAVILGSINVDIFSRFMEYYMIGIYGIMTLSYKIFNEQSRKVYMLVFYLALIVIMLRQLIVYGGGYLLNYGFFF